MLGVASSVGLDMSLANFLDFASQLKVRLVEVKMDEPHLISALFKAKHRKAVLDITASFDFRYLVHLPYIDVNLAGLNPTLRKASEKSMLKGIEFAADVDARLVVCHVGRLSRDFRNEMIARSFKNALSCLKNLTTASKNHGIVFTVENDHMSNDHILAGFPEELLVLVEEAGCQLTLDVGHANTVTKIENFMDTLARHIVNIHLHDNNGEQDEHLSLGKGSMDFSAVMGNLRRIRYSGPLIVEVHSIAGLRESVGVVTQALSKHHFLI